MDTIGVSLHERTRVVATDLSEIRDRITVAHRILLCLDFDGTLAPIVPLPDEARLPDPTRDALLALSRETSVLLVFVSGRMLKDLRHRLGIPHAIYAGNHGLEIDGLGFSFTHEWAVESEPLMHGLGKRLTERLMEISGAFVEDKGLTLSVHHRLVRRDELPALVKGVAEVLDGYTRSIDMTEGLEVLEFRPRVNWNKGSAVAWIREKIGDALPIYIGDDRTDEDAFSSTADGITIHTGELSTTIAQYRLAGPDGVLQFLEWLGSTRQKGGKAQ